MSVPDRIQKSIVIRAPIERVWRAVSNSNEFGAWFGIEFDGPFRVGERLTGRMAPTKVDPEVAKLQEPHAGTLSVWLIERMEPPAFLSFRWHPFAVEREDDFTNEPTTLVEFELTEVSEGTRVQITESGFSKIPLERRVEAFTSNEGGWEHQTKLLSKYLASHAPA